MSHEFTMQQPGENRRKRKGSLAGYNEINTKAFLHPLIATDVYGT